MKSKYRMRNIKKFICLGMLGVIALFQLKTQAANVEVGSFSFTIYAGGQWLSSTSEVTKMMQTSYANVHIGTYKAGGYYPTRMYAKGGSTFTPETVVYSTGTYHLYYNATAKTGRGYILNVISHKDNPNNTKVAGSWTP